MLDLDNGDGGEYIRFKPSVNAWYVDGEEFDLKGLAIDPASLNTGWGKIQEGEAPVWAWDDTVGVRSPRPEGDYKRGFSVKIWLKDKGWREWSSNGAGVNKGLSNIWKSIHDGIAANQGKLAGLKYTGSTADTSGKGATRIPNFELIQWIDNPGVESSPAPVSPPAQKDDDPLF